MADCPRPEKHRHPTRDAAQAAIVSLYRAGKGNPDLVAYQCVCGAWHVGHNLAHFRKRIRRALAAGNRTTSRTQGRRR